MITSRPAAKDAPPGLLSPEAASGPQYKHSVRPPRNETGAATAAIKAAFGEPAGKAAD
jgi:hypothetical protein